MGSKCSTIVCSRVALPSRKADPISVTPTSTQKPSKRSSVPRSRRFSRNEEQSTVIENCRSPEYLANNPSKTKGLVAETSTDDALRRTSFSHSTEPGLFQYKKGPLIGKGAYGEVYECLRLNTGELLAVKSFKLGGDTNKAESYIEKLKREVQQLRDLSHNNIVKYFTVDVSEAPNSPSLVVDIILEYVSGGSVRGLLDKFSRLEEKVVAKYIRQVLDGLVYLHDNGIIHRNIKGANILIDTTGLIKLTDFGGSGRPDRFSEENTPENPKASAYYRGPAYWSAPEVVLRKAQGKPADVWSVGCVVIEMLTGSPPWKDQVKTMNDFSKQISFGTPPTFPNSISENCRDFLYKTLKFRPEDRPTVLDLLDHPFVKEKNQDSSYLEAESIQADQDGKGSPERVLDLLRMDSKPQEKRVIDPKKNNFLSKYSTDELSINGLTVDAYNSFGSNEFAGHILSLKDRSQSKMSEKFEKDPNFLSLSKKVSNSKHREVSTGATNERDEGKPIYSEQVINEMKTGVILKSKNDQRSSNVIQDSSEIESKEAIRKRIEEEMNRDLMLISGQLSTGDENEPQQNEYERDSTKYQEENKTSSWKRPTVTPIQNSFFNTGSPNENDSNSIKINNQHSTTQFLRNKTGERKQSWKMKSSGGIIVKDAENSSRTQEDAGNNFANPYRMTSENAKKVIMEQVEEEDNEDTSPGNFKDESEMKRAQERLRRQFEEQMEMSLARLNSENLQTVPDKEGEPDTSLWTNSKMSPQEKRRFDEDEINQIIKITPANLGDVWRIEDSGPEATEVSDSKSNNWKGGWEGHDNNHEDSSKGLSPHMTESDGKSPTEKQNRKRISEFAKFNVREVSSASFKNDSFEKSDNLEEFQEQGYEEMNSLKESRVEALEGNQEKLGIINEAEEVKEDSLYDDEITTRGGPKPRKA